jgi:hypothetical protein
MEKIVLKTSEWLLKVSVNNAEPDPLRRKKGFLTKLTKKGEIPEAFKMWPEAWRGHNEVVPSKVHKEEFAEGWMVLGYRRGGSQDWAVLRHPKGFTLEIYLVDFMNMLPNITVEDGRLLGMFKWIGNDLMRF